MFYEQALSLTRKQQTQSIQHQVAEGMNDWKLYQAEMGQNPRFYESHQREIIASIDDLELAQELVDFHNDIQAKGKEAFRNELTRTDNRFSFDVFDGELLP